MSFYVIIRGPLGCGKSTIAKRLSKVLKAEYFAIDKFLDDAEEGGFISQKSCIRANVKLALHAKRILSKDRPVIFDGNFYWTSQIKDLINRLDFPRYVFTLRAPLKVCIARDSARRKHCGVDATRVVFKKSTEFDYGIVINVDRSLQVCLKELISNMKKRV